MLNAVFRASGGLKILPIGILQMGTLKEREGAVQKTMRFGRILIPQSQFFVNSARIQSMVIVEDLGAEVVLIDDYRVEGWLDDRSCPCCSKSRVYAIRYDSYFCPSCNLWLEAGCPDATCDFCRTRPVRPLPSPPFRES